MRNRLVAGTAAAAMLVAVGAKTVRAQTANVAPQSDTTIETNDNYTQNQTLDPSSAKLKGLLEAACQVQRVPVCDPSNSTGDDGLNLKLYSSQMRIAQKPTPAGVMDALAAALGKGATPLQGPQESFFKNNP